MQIPENSRRNFISNIAFLSAGIMIKPAIKSLPLITGQVDIRNRWESFWEKTGGRKTHNVVDLQKNNALIITKGHVYRNGDIISFSKENILAQPTWIYWKSNKIKPDDVLISLYERDSLKKITRLNRFETNALYKVAEVYRGDNLLEAYCNSLRPSIVNTMSLLKSRTLVNKNSQEYQVSYYKNRSLVLDKKFIYHS